MISREMMIGGGALVALLLAGGVAYAASTSAASSGAAAGTLVFKAGHRYEVDLEIPAGTTYTTASVPNATQAQANLDTIASGAFSLVGVGASVSSTAAPGSGFKVYFIVDVAKDITVNQSDLLAGTPAGTTVTATDEGLTSGLQPSAKSFDAANAIPAVLGTSITIPVGTSIALQIPGGSASAYWQSTAATTSNAAIVVPAASGSTGFVGVAPGTATLTGYYVDASGAKQTDTVVVTVVAKGAGAISSGSGSAGAHGSSSSSSSSASSSSGAATVVATSVIGAPTSGGWTTDVTLGPDSVTVSAWPGDSIVIALPSGGTWAATGSTAGFPTSGSTPFQGSYSSPVVVTLAWSLGGVSFSTTLTFKTGRTFGLATSWQPNDTVRASISPSDYAAITAAANANAAELAALQALVTTLQTQGVTPANMTPAEAMFYFLQTGPWGKLISPIVDTLKVWAVATSGGSSTSASPSSFPIGGQSLPSDWASSDTTGLIRAEFRYSGAGISNAELPFPMTTWVRLT